MIDISRLKKLISLMDLAIMTANSISRQTGRKLERITMECRNLLNSTFTATPSSLKREKRPTIMLRSDQAAEIGTEEDAVVRVGNKLGSLLIHVQIFDGLQPGTVIVEGVWPNKFFIEKVGINLLVSSEAGKPAGGAVFHDTAVWVKADSS